jgi:WD40 repeat protein
MSGVKRSPRLGAALKPCWQADLPDHVIALAWSPDGTMLAAAAVSGSIVLFDIPTGKVSHSLPGHELGTTAVGFSHDGVHFASAGQDGKVRLWDQATGRERLALDGGAPWVERLAWCPVDNLLATSAGRRLRLWDPQGRLVRDYPEHGSTIADIQWKPRSRELASASYGCVALWTPDRSEPLRRFEWKGSQLVLAWSPDGKYLATGDQDCTVHFWIVRVGEDLQMSGYPRKVRELAWDSTSTFLATGGGDTPCVWDCSGKGPAGTKPTQLEGHEAAVSALAYQHAGPLLASGGQDGLLAVWRPTKSRKPLAASVQEGGLACLAWSPDDNRLAAGDEGGRVVVFQRP